MTQAGLANGANSLHLELTEPGGPPGIIRAGASGTITVYGKTPRIHRGIPTSTSLSSKRQENESYTFKPVYEKYNH